MSFSVHEIRKDFKGLSSKVNGHPLVYFDSGATSIKPEQVVNVIDTYYRTETSSVHRGVHHFSEKATASFEQARVKIQKFINASSEKEIVFTSGTTASINLVAQSYGKKYLQDGDEIIITELEHHANIVSWQLLQSEIDITLKVIPVLDSGELDFAAYLELLSDKTKIVAFSHVSNVLGTINPAKKIIEHAHKVGAITLVDGAQAVPHIRVDVQDLGADFYAFSGHKLLAGTGCGVLYGKYDLLENMPPIIGGGAMIELVSFEKTTFKKAPEKFEAGTPNIAGVLSMGAAIDYFEQVGFEGISKYEEELKQYFLDKFSKHSFITILGQKIEETVPVFSLVIDGVHPHDIGTLLDQKGIAVRVGHHCCQPLMRRFDVPATSRASLSFFNTKEEIDLLHDELVKIWEMFK